MKYLIIIFLFVIGIPINAVKYYVAPSGGSDAYPGTFAEPWASWEKAFTSTAVSAGDTVFFRGGTYQTTIVTGEGIVATRSGTSNNWIVYINYPSEEPILDCGNIEAEDIWYEGLRNVGLTIGVDYVKLRGLKVRNVKQYYDRNFGVGIRVEGANVTVENCEVYNVWGHGFELWHGGMNNKKINIINCDSHHNCDSISGDPLGSNAGNTGAGFSCWTSDVTDGEIYFYGCRAWAVSDQGFMIGADYHIKCEECWSFGNKAYVKGGGVGWKMGWIDEEHDILLQELYKCISAFNDGDGFMTNDWYGADVAQSQVYNNLTYRNANNNPDAVAGHYIATLSSGTTDHDLLRFYRNNISLGDKTAVHLRADARYTHSNNSWDGGATITAADFKALPVSDAAGITLLSGARQSDGSLPDLGNYFQLAEGSDAIEAGVDVGFGYKDLGPFEYGEDEPNDATDIITFTFPEQTGSGTINVTLHTVSIEVEWDADITDLTPTITLSYGATIDPLSGVSQDFTSPVVYTVTAEDAVTEQEWTVTITQEAEPSTGIKLLKKGIRLLKKGTKFLK